MTSPDHHPQTPSAPTSIDPTEVPLPRAVDTASETHTRRGEPRPFDAILFSSFGGPNGQEDVIPFLRNVTRGRGIPDERLEEVAVHYRTMGGVSPITAQNERMIAALEAELSRRGLDLPVYFGNRNWKPFNAEAVRQLHSDGHRHALGLVTSAFSSYSSCRQYREDFAMALEETGLTGELTIDKIRVYATQRGFLEPVVDGIREAVRELRAEGHTPERIQILFSTHSIPVAMAEASGPQETRVPGSGGWYVAQHLSACRWVADQLGADGEGLPAWRLVYQSRSGSPHTPWLGPDINEVIEEITEARSADAVVVVPIGFVTDHMEVVWDLDTEAKDTAAAQGLAFRRVATAGSDPRFIAALADLIEERLDPSRPREDVIDFGPTPDVCGPRCCVGRMCRPTVSGVDSAEDVERARETAARGAGRADGVSGGRPGDRPAAADGPQTTNTAQDVR